MPLYRYPTLKNLPFPELVSVQGTGFVNLRFVRATWGSPIK